MKILISDKLSESALSVFKQSHQFTVLYEPDAGKDPEKLKTLIADVEGLAIRSASNITAAIINAAQNLKVIGRAGIGVDNVDLDAASKKGIIVMNTPLGNAITTAEHAISMMCALTRNIPQANASLKEGRWDKSKFMGSELYHKTLGVLGCGNIGKIVVNRAQGLHMKILCYDPFLSDDKALELGIEKCDLSTLLEKSDYITIHTPKNEKTTNLINQQAFAKMKPGMFLINCARGGIVNEKDLLLALENKIVAGAALDVFEKEPVDPENPLLKHDNVIATPHLGASTEEAQENVAQQIAQQMSNYLLQGNIVNAVNTVSASADVLKRLGSSLKLGNKLGLLQGQLCDEAPQEIHIKYYGDAAREQTEILTTAILQGVLQPMLSQVAINYVNAPYLAKERGIRIIESKITAHSDYTMMIEVICTFNKSERIIAGTLFGKNNPRIVRFNNIYPEINPEGTMLLVENNDKPGVMGRVGTFLGEHNVNIANMQLCLDTKTKTATAFYAVQGNVEKNTLKELGKLDDIISVKSVTFSR
ncbi:phosphoglycerate dehydrogenase [bacterium]|nr:phosphoglycerate dehydrogenase [bacterium]